MTREEQDEKEYREFKVLHQERYRLIADWALKEFWLESRRLLNIRIKELEEEINNEKVGEIEGRAYCGTYYLEENSAILDEDIKYLLTKIKELKQYHRLDIDYSKVLTSRIKELERQAEQFGIDDIYMTDKNSYGD